MMFEQINQSYYAFYDIGPVTLQIWLSKINLNSILPTISSTPTLWVNGGELKGLTSPHILYKLSDEFKGVGDWAVTQVCIDKIEQSIIICEQLLINVNKISVYTRFGKILSLTEETFRSHKQGEQSKVINTKKCC